MFYTNRNIAIGNQVDAVNRRFAQHLKDQQNAIDKTDYQGAHLPRVVPTLEGGGFWKDMGNTLWSGVRTASPLLSLLPYGGALEKAINVIGNVTGTGRKRGRPSKKAGGAIAGSTAGGSHILGGAIAGSTAGNHKRKKKDILPPIEGGAVQNKTNVNLMKNLLSGATKIARNVVSEVKENKKNINPPSLPAGGARAGARAGGARAGATGSRKYEKKKLDSIPDNIQDMTGGYRSDAGLTGAVVGQGKKHKKGAKASGWIEHVKAYSKAHKCSYKEAMSKAKATYKK